MNEALTAKRKSPTDGQLALAEAVRDGGLERGHAITSVPARGYTDPAHFAREKAALFERLP